MAFSIMSFGQTATATIKAIVVTPLSILKTFDMDFGSVAVSPTVPGTVILTPASVRSITGGSQIIGTTAKAATFTVTGQGTSTYAITLTPASLTVTNGSNSMIVNNFNSTPTTTTGGALVGGTQTLTVGATLNMTAAQATGTYNNPSGTPLSVTVAYN